MFAYGHYVGLKGAGEAIKNRKELEANGWLVQDPIPEVFENQAGYGRLILTPEGLFFRAYNPYAPFTDGYTLIPIRSVEDLFRIANIFAIHPDFQDLAPNWPIQHPKPEDADKIDQILREHAVPIPDQYLAV